jgi:hypothetical protein
MDYQTIFNIGLGLVASLLGWLARQLWEAVHELKKDLSSIREELPKQYVHKDDYRVDIGRIHELLDKIYTLIATKG